MVSMFRADAPAALRRIKAALAKREGEALRLAAHSLKGALAALGSPAGRQLAAELEYSGRDQQFEVADTAFQALVECLARLDEAFVNARLVTVRRRPAPRARSSSAATRRKRKRS
jgi:HPt (histidine-containing phosphotransfer) domain-containing protein